MSTEQERDTALGIAQNIAQVTEKHGIFVLTGSYSIDALTKGRIHHNDIDANLFVKNINAERTQAINDTILEEIQTAERTLQRPDRLEYMVGANVQKETAELQLIEYAEHLQGIDGEALLLPGTNEAGNDMRVPLTTVALVDSQERSYEFKVKSLSYAIATWAIRISGIINYQKRPVRQTDIDHFAVLLNQLYNLNDVHVAIAHHPQMVLADPDTVLDEAMRKTN